MHLVKQKSNGEGPLRPQPSPEYTQYKGNKNLCSAFFLSSWQNQALQINEVVGSVVNHFLEISCRKGHTDFLDFCRSIIPIIITHFIIQRSRRPVVANLSLLFSAMHSPGGAVDS